MSQCHLCPPDDKCVHESCKDRGMPCTYSKAMGQDYPRACTWCGRPETTALISGTPLQRDWKIALDLYERDNLVWLLDLGRRLGCDTGDWLGQIRRKLGTQTSETYANYGPGTTERLYEQIRQTAKVADLEERVRALRQSTSDAAACAQAALARLEAQGDADRAVLEAADALYADPSSPPKRAALLDAVDARRRARPS